MHPLYEHISQKILGQNELVESLLLTLIAQEHILLIGPPGTGKTRSIEHIAQSVNGMFGRIQFTADMLPMDIRGAEVFRPQSGIFEIQKGPVFVNYLLADELNRAPAKVQSALLDAMQERNISIAGKTFELPRPFCVFATMNFLDDHGTFELPFAQLDRFAQSIILEHPGIAIERQILDLQQNSYEKKIFSLEDLHLQYTQVRVDPILKDYIARFTTQLRPEYTRFEVVKNKIASGPSSRASLALLNLARARAVLRNRDHVLFEDISILIPRIYQHRCRMKYEFQGEIKEILQEIQSSTPLIYESV